MNMHLPEVAEAAPLAAADGTWAGDSTRATVAVLDGIDVSSSDDDYSSVGAAPPAPGELYHARTYDGYEYMQLPEASLRAIAHPPALVHAMDVQPTPAGSKICVRKTSVDVSDENESMRPELYRRATSEQLHGRTNDGYEYESVPIWITGDPIMNMHLPEVAEAAPLAAADGTWAGDSTRATVAVLDGIDVSSSDDDYSSVGAAPPAP